MTVKINWRGDEVRKTMQERAAKVLKLVAESIVDNVQDELYPGHGELSGDLKASYAYSLQRDDVDARDLPSEDALLTAVKKGLSFYVGSTWAYAFQVDQGRGSFEGYNQLILALDKTTGDIKWLIKQVKHG